MKILLSAAFPLLLLLTGCLGSNGFSNDNGENIILTDESCLSGDCDTGDLDPLIDYTDNVPEGIDIDEYDTQYPDNNINDVPEICDAATDNDGDGLPCPCDENDNTAWKHDSVADCDADGDGIPEIYDLCPNNNDAADVITVHLCDVQEDLTGIFSEVNYDSERWDEDTCEGNQALSPPFQKTKDVTPDTDVILNKYFINFPVLYVFPDENQNGRPDGCDMAINKNPDFGPWAGK